MPASFTLRLPSSDSSGLDELGIWLPEAAQAFALEEQAPAAVWQVDLPAGQAAARQAILMRALRLESAAQALPAAGRRLEAFAAGGIFQPASFGAETAVGAAGQASVLLPEQNLAEWVYQAALPPSFAGGPALDWRQTAQEARALLEKARQLLSLASLVETRQSGRRIGLTRFSWEGDFVSIANAHPRPGDAGLHAANLALVTRSQAALLSLAGLLLSGSLKLAALFAANPVLAVPATFRFLRQVLQQFQELANLSATV